MLAAYRFDLPEGAREVLAQALLRGFGVAGGDGVDDAAAYLARGAVAGAPDELVARMAREIPRRGALVKQSGASAD